ncbi:hypothetical protein PC111_g5581 [Phytophthora cactorum]|nr:hypothetical protein PC112_g9351 [Phytophthora cactorum]KAG2835046.1 hypothetical protein PC111_g5581 [Phytophthora cactorum]KAG4056247.1 hypothetical protein PC123_g8710 [Phytophthora cactorum]
MSELPELPRSLELLGSLRRQSSHRPSNRHASLFKPEVPPHLLKLLQKTPEEQERVAAARAILMDEPALRNEQSLDLVYSWMLQNCKQYSNNIFGAAPEYIRREICRQMRLMKVKSGGLVIRQGDTGDRCYIVVDGLVDVYVKIEKPGEVVVTPASPPPMLSTMKQRRTSRRLSSEVNSAPVDFGAMVANLGPGAMFGEIVLLNPSAKRNATIKASQFTESCDLICLERADYIRLVRTASMEASHYNNAEVLDRMFLFRDWVKLEKMRLVSAMRSRHFTSNFQDYLYRAGTDAKWMFIVTSGEVMERINWTLDTAGSDAAMRRLVLSQSSSRKNPEKIVNVELTLIGSGDIAGELPFVASKRGATFDIKAVTDVQALAIDRRYYETVMLTATRDNKPEVYATMKKLRKFSQDREDWRQQRMECGISYPSAHVNITWHLMRMSNPFSHEKRLQQDQPGGMTTASRKQHAQTPPFVTFSMIRIFPQGKNSFNGVGNAGYCHKGFIILVTIRKECRFEDFPDSLQQRESSVKGDAVTAADAEAADNVEADEQVPEEVSVSRLTKQRREEELPEEKHQDLAQIMRSYVKQRDLAVVTTLKRSPQ